MQREKEFPGQKGYGIKWVSNLNTKNWNDDTTSINIPTLSNRLIEHPSFGFVIF
jgi:hypothetical protein